MGGICSTRWSAHERRPTIGEGTPHDPRPRRRRGRAGMAGGRALPIAMEFVISRRETGRAHDGVLRCEASLWRVH
jgi:hypothetical protein